MLVPSPVHIWCRFSCFFLALFFLRIALLLSSFYLVISKALEGFGRDFAKGEQGLQEP